ncbi:MAG: hypothetical protein KAH32_04510 [Chlamydiia bacterium]|nr:hypothetical protein [Chlamydiia bacterium]
MKKEIILLCIAVVSMSSCMKDIDINEERIHISPKETFFVANNIQHNQTFFRFYENAVIDVSTNSNTIWDLTFETSAEGNRVFPNYTMGVLTHETSFSSVEQVTRDYVSSIIGKVEKWKIDDPQYSTITDSLHFAKADVGTVFVLENTNHENNDLKYVAVNITEKSNTQYSFEYQSVINPDLKGSKIIKKDKNYSYVYFSFEENEKVELEPIKDEWDMVATPFFGWYETNTIGVFMQWMQSGFLINNEAGIEATRIYDEDITFDDIDLSFIDRYEFSDMKGIIGGRYKLLGDKASGDVYTMDVNKKYIIKVLDKDDQITKYYKFTVIYYKNDHGENHYPTVQFEFLE